VPVLLLAGELDLSTPVAWARQEQAKTHNGMLLEIGGVGHSVQTGPKRRDALRAVQRFLRR
jgi:hypothetical protein